MKRRSYYIAFIIVSVCLAAAFANIGAADYVIQYRSNGSLETHRYNNYSDYCHDRDSLEAKGVKIYTSFEY